MHQMPRENMCQCKKHPDLVVISDRHSDFKKRYVPIVYGSWILLMRCESGGQFWKVGEWDKYQVSYAAKIPN